MISALDVPVWASQDQPTLDQQSTLLAAGCVKAREQRSPSDSDRPESHSWRRCYGV
jgi:hypothetical protein